MYLNEFTARQVMNAPDFELYHYLDQNPPEVELHSHEFYEVFFFLSGKVNYTVEGRWYQLRPGDILLTNNLDIHRPVVEPGKAYERYVLWLDCRFIDELSHRGDDLSACFLDAAEKKYKLIRPSGAVLSQLRRLCERQLQLQHDGGFGSRTLQYAGITEFLVYLNRAYYDTPSAIRSDITENETINQVIAQIELHLTEELSLDRLSETFHLSRYHLDRQFKQYTGLPIYQYIIKKRLIRARNLLREGQSVTDACMNAGFGDYSNFLKAFKREFGCTPKHYSIQRL